MVSSSHMKLLSQTMQGSNNDNVVNESKEFDGAHYFVGSFCFTGVSGSCVIPSIAHSPSHLIPGGICPSYCKHRRISHTFSLKICVSNQHTH